MQKFFLHINYNKKIFRHAFSNLSVLTDSYFERNMENVVISPGMLFTFKYPPSPVTI